MEEGEKEIEGNEKQWQQENREISFIRHKGIDWDWEEGKELRRFKNITGIDFYYGW
jgi:hypothetical protein